MRRYIKTLIVTIFTVLLLNCSSSTPEEKNNVSPYIDSVEVTVSLGSSDNLNKMDEPDIFYTVRNKGKKSITKLRGDVIFYDSGENEVGRTGWLFIWKNKSLEEMASSPDKKAKHRPLPPGESLEGNTDVLVFFGGERDLQEKLEKQWDEIKPKVDINKITTNSKKDNK